MSLAPVAASATAVTTCCRSASGVSSVSWAASLQAMPPASVQREIALEMAMSNYLAMQNYRVQLYNSALQASLLAATAERNGAPPVQMPSPSIASN